MNKHLLTIDDLYSFFATQDQSYQFNSNDTNQTIVVQINETMTFSEENNSCEGLLKTHLKSCHLYRNRNSSSISEESMTEAIPSFYNRPILGYIHQLSDGSYDFAGHEFSIDEDGNVEYLEVPVGVIPESCNAQLVYDEEKDKIYLELDGLIYEDYSKAASILMQKGESKVSVEIAVDEMSYSATEKVLNIDKFHFMGVTILGHSADGSERVIEEGMEGSNITLADFSAEKNSMFSSENHVLIEMLEKINSKIDTLSDFTINQNIFGKEEQEMDTTTEILGEKETKIVESLVDETPGTDPVIEKESVEVRPEKYSVIYTDGSCKEFALSLNDITNALHTLVNDTYGESDNTYYCVDVYEDNYVVMFDCWNGNAYRQNYKREEDNFSLVGDRVEVFKNYLTKEEEAALAEMKIQYTLMEEELNTYKAIELNAKKEEIFNSEDYDSIKESEEFMELKSNADKYSVEEVTEKCDALLLSYVKSNRTFAATKPATRVVKVAAPQEETYSPYGNLFSNYKK